MGGWVSCIRADTLGNGGGENVATEMNKSAPPDHTSALADNTSAPADNNTSTVVDNTSMPVDNTSAPTDNTSVPTDNTSSPDDDIRVGRSNTVVAPIYASTTLIAWCALVIMRFTCVLD